MKAKENEIPKIKHFIIALLYTATGWIILPYIFFGVNLLKMDHIVEVLLVFSTLLTLFIWANDDDSSLNEKLDCNQY